MNDHTIIRRLSIISVCLLAACAPFGKQSPLETPTAYSLPQGNTLTIARADWWQQLGNAKLNRLIEQALATSPDLRAVKARFEQAQAQLGITEAATKTQIGLTARGAGVYVSPKPTSLQGDTDHTLDLANIALQGSWSFDFWGKNRAEVAAVLGKRQATAYEFEQSRLSLAQAVAAQYFAWQGLSAQRQIIEQRIANSAALENLLAQRVRAKLLPGNAVYTAQLAQQQLKAQLLQIDRNIARVRHALATLSGQSPNTFDTQTPAAMKKAPMLKTSKIYADFLGGRPDIAAQRSLLESRLQNIKVAKASFYPNIELKLLAGMSHIDAFNVISGKNSGMLGILPAINLPLFTSGALQSQLAARNAEYNEQVAVYDRTVLNAMRSAADALSDYETLNAQTDLQNRAVQTSAKAASSSLRRVGAGLENKADYLQKQDQVLQMKLQSVQSEADLLTAWSNVHAQLGGGFRAE